MNEVPATWRQRSRSAGALAAMGWSLIYASVVATGQRFSTSYLDFGWQMIPWDILSSDPLRSTWYLHIQPPLWNLLLGTSAWLSPISDAVTLQVLMAIFGIVAAAASAILAERLGMSRRVAVITALVATVNPEVLKGAFEPTYELAIGALLVVTLAILASLRSPTVHSRTIHWLAASATVIAMTRSLYHPMWVLLILGIAFSMVRSRVSRRTIVLALGVPLLVMGSWMLKNQVLFGQFSMSSWFGMNLQRAVIPVLDLEDLQDMHNNGDVSDIAMIGPFGKYELYVHAVPPCVPRHTHRSLSEPTRTTDRWSPNFNYECYLPIFERAGEDAIAVARAHPGAWWEGRMWSLRSMMAVAITPAQSPSVVMRAMDSVFSLVRVDWGGVLSTRGWGTPIYGQLTAPVEFGLILIPIYSVVILSGVLACLVAWRRRHGWRRAAIWVAISSTVAYTVIVGAVAELGEQARFRTMTDPVAVVSAVGIGTYLVRYVCSNRTRRRSTSE